MNIKHKVIESFVQHHKVHFYEKTPVPNSVDEAGFEECSFSDVDFSKTLLTKCRFEKCIFDGCNFNTAKLIGSKIIDCKFNLCRLTGVNWSELDTAMGFSLMCEDCELSYSVFGQITLKRSFFKNCKIHEAEFIGVNLQGASFEGSDLLNTRFTDCNMEETNFEKALNYIFDVRVNKCKKAKFSRSEVENLLIPFNIVVKGN